MVKPVEKREVADYLRNEHGFSLVRSCTLVKLDRSSYYYKAAERDDSTLREAIKRIAAERKRFGYRRIYIMLRRAGFTDNHKRVYRIYTEEELQVRKRKRKKATRWRGEKPQSPVRANERWSMDFVHDSLENGRKIRVLTVVDDYTRECIHLEVDSSLSGHRVARVLEQLKYHRGLPEKLLTDNGSEFTGKALDSWAYAERVKQQFIEPGKPVQNCYVESFNGKFRDECLNEHWFMNITDAKTIIEKWRIDYNQDRPHSSLNNLTPLEFIYKESGRSPRGTITAALDSSGIQSNSIGMSHKKL